MAPAPKNPTDIARETIRQLAVRRIPPTPDHYQEIYAEIAGAPLEVFPGKSLKRLVAEIGRAVAIPGLERGLHEAVGQKDWARFAQVLIQHLGDLFSTQQLAWNTLIRELFRQWENNAARLTTAQKREALEHVLQSAGGSPGTLFARLEGLQKGWAQAREDETRPLEVPGDPAGAASGYFPDVLNPVAHGVLPELGAALRELFAYTLENCLRVFLGEDERLGNMCRELVGEVRCANTPRQFQALRQKLKNFAFRLELLDGDQRELRASLLKLLRLMVENVSELVLDDQWIHGQIEVVRAIVDKPLSQKSLDDAEQRFKEIVYKQSQLKLGLQEARDALKAMLAGFVDHLNDFAGATSDYHDKIGEIARHVSSADNIADLESVLAEIMRETRGIQASARRSHDELIATRERVRETEARIQKLERELAETSQLIRLDQLTGVLNRRGLEEVVDKEIKRAERRQAPLCLALLDVDNFKKLNDILGHAAGDDALKHLIAVIQGTLRPQDSVARFGGEEFIILFPETALEQAATAMVRIQRELTRHIFLYNNQKLLITFSAGITMRRTGEYRETLIQRADAAMYEAKQSGKNQVVVADDTNVAGALR
ncbi:MAG: diguanylate cyclase [Zoogloeaceae bacterium]|jgi:diguanylate cyclase|nr:diguanylate cyclase [Zoogloeaceae bacterium]